MPTIKNDTATTKNRFDLTSKLALVTGASSGLGLSIAGALHDAGARVVMTSSNHDRINRAVKELQADRLGSRVVGLTMDVRDRESVRSCFQMVAETWGDLDILVANAGISAGSGFNTDAGKLTEVKDADWDNVINTNLTGLFTCISAAAEPMIKQQSGRVVAISSIGGMRSESMVGYAYAASKAAVINLVRHAAMELAQHNVTVNGIAPGPFLTDIAGGKLHNPDVASSLAARIPLGRLAAPSEINELALLLCSDASSFITGQTIAIDGGLTAR